jgi:tetratricopeptide (TPR) repeat protein
MFNGMRKFFLPATGLMAIAAMISLGCDKLKPQSSTPEPVKVAKVDTDYVYEANIDKSLQDYQASRRSRISNFVGFSPDEILRVREDAIDRQIREQIKRLPGVNISNSEVEKLANDRVQELAWRLYHELAEQGADFASLAREYSVGMSAQSGGKLTPFGRVPTPEEYQARAYTMKVGDISEPFYAWDGWRIIRLDEITQDSLMGDLYTVSMILLRLDVPAAEAEIIDRMRSLHTIEVLDPKYNARRALEAENFQGTLDAADKAIAKDSNDDLAHYLRTRALWGLGRQDEAIEELQTAADVSIASRALRPYYLYYKGEYLEELVRKDDALAAYRASFDEWRQDITLAFQLLAKFQALQDAEYEAKVKDEIDIIAKQDSIALAFGRRQAGGGNSVIVTGEGQVQGDSTEFVPGYEKDE